jgi:hypothetical protein
VNIYSQKQRWKLLLAGTAILIIIASLWYTNVLVQKIASEERNKVQLWAEAIQNKASLVNYTAKLFEKISTEERNKIEIWAEASKRIVTSDNQNVTTFYLQIIGANETIPVLILDENDKIMNYRNFDMKAGDDTTAFLMDQLGLMKNKDAPIELKIHVTKNLTWSYRLYYKDSKIFSELKVVLDDLIQSFISEIVINSASVPVIYTDTTKCDRVWKLKRRDYRYWRRFFSGYNL